ncbi:MAG: hypothetical protein ABIL68_03400 [bacterium]
MKRIFWVFIFVVYWTGRIAAQLQTYNHPELEWRTIETDHFFVHFHQGAERTASLVAKIGEEIYEPVTSLYGYEPDGKIHFIVRDHDDNSNGAAFYYDNKVEIWAPAGDFALRGTHNWLRDVVTHEFSHMISLGAARKMPRRIPAVYFQWFDYERERRPDVLHGYPQTLVSFPLAGTVIPNWFAEGVSQFQRAGLDYDMWDTHRDMVLRTAVLGNGLLSLTEMGIFGKNSLGNERVYNQGYGLTLYIVHRYGEEALADLIRAMKKPWRLGFSGAVEKVLRMSEKALYDEWIAWLKEGYGAENRSVRRLFVEGRIVEGRGIGNFHPVFSPDGMRMAYISNRNKDYLSQLDLWIMDIRSAESRKIKSGVTSSVSWSPDGRKLVYAKRTARTRQGSHYYDLYTYDLEKKEEKRITRALRVREPDWSPDGRMFVCVVEEDGTSNVAVVDADGGGFRKVTSFLNGEQVFTPRWMGGSGRIVFAVSETGNGRDIALIDSNGSDLRYLIRTEYDERDPFPSGDGRTIFYSSDRTGIFNVYRMDGDSGAETQVTDVLGGAFMPAVDGEGRLAYAAFTPDGYAIAVVDSQKIIDPSKMAYVSPYDSIREKMRSSRLDIAQFDDRDAPEYPSRPYKPIYSKVSFLPRVMVDYPRKVKVGTYFYGSDFLDKISLLGGVAVNGLLDTDVFGIFEYKRFYPTLFLEAYQQMRHTSDEDMKVRFNLMEVDAGADWRLGDRDLLRTAFVYSRYDARMTFEEQGQIIKFPYTYHMGSALQLRWTHTSVPPSVLSGIAPTSGRTITLQIDRCWQRFLNGFVVHPQYGTIIEQFDHFDYEQILLDWREYRPSFLKNHSLVFRLRAGLIDQPVHSFYHFFAGGLDGLKGYPYYSIEGRKLLHLGLAYRFPVFRKMGLRFLFLNFDKLFLSLYGDAGNAWGGTEASDARWKKVIGIQLRLSVFSFYSYPLSVFVDAAYGLDGFEHRNQTYGEEWRFYFGILFDFLD